MTNILLSVNACDSDELKYLHDNFFGTVILSINDFKTHCDEPTNTTLYVCGDISDITDISSKVSYVINELSYNIPDNTNLINLGQVPINIYNVGVYFRGYFKQDYYSKVTNEHSFQSLTESNKAGHAFRKGIYLTHVHTNDIIKFKLLRCSTNLDGATDNFRSADLEIINTVNTLRAQLYTDSSEFNHVLAQTYHNTIDAKTTKQQKARIKKHSDKTKDMPKNALIAFCTFYEGYNNGFSKFQSHDYKKYGFDYKYKHKTSVLTKLRFRLKSQVYSNLQPKFDITLYPGSIFIIPLLTNRLYTHEIVPSSLPVDKIPVRLGYVCRSSATNAIFKDGQTYIDTGNGYVLLEEPTREGVQELKEAYLTENTTIEEVNYDKFLFSLNTGDYKCPM